ncbi:MAG: glycerol-3-phosphate dehydrogenase [Magnetospiraceae bacterium]
MNQHPFDLAIVGGGVNGCGIARDAAGRGLSVFLCDQGDWANATSSASTKLVHGGLRYLEHYEFRLVRESLKEREVLWAMAPHIIHPLRFVLPHNPAMRPGWMIRLGLFLYDHLGGRKALPGTQVRDLTTDPLGLPLRGNFTKAFEYSDCWVDDARLVVLNALDANEKGATIAPRTRCTHATPTNGKWRLTLEDAESDTPHTIDASMLINATGPWVSQFATEFADLPTKHKIRRVKGSHIVVPRLFDHDQAYIFQNEDRRIVFAIPYEKNFTLIGTTDEDFDADPGTVRISEQEIEYLCAVANTYFTTRIQPDDVVYTFSGVRPLYDDGASKAQEATRDYVLKVDGGHDGIPPILHIFGGKITTYRRLAEEVLDALSPFCPTMGAQWTTDSTLPGGNFPISGILPQIAGLMRQYPFLTPEHGERLIRHYGKRATDVLGMATSVADLGPCFGADLYAREVNYLREKEWAFTAEDVLWRRTKMGLRLDAAQTQAVADYMARPRTTNAGISTRGPANA